MIIVYEAKSSIDANIVQDILLIDGINCHIMGGYLEGGVGELQPMGLIKVMTDEKDFQAAKKIIAEWESEKPEQTKHDQTIENKNIAQTKTYKKPLVGLTIALFILFFYFLSLR
ncbi:MAG: DUF2007 domain-containing protein [Alcanivoracaceae bacterium]|nr:DUF2007 domain-containing protein [Alcanivoracaceae bacterium]